MTFNDQIERTRKDLEKTFVELEKNLADPTPLYAVVGVGDFAVEKLREVRAELSARASRIDPKTLRDQAQAGVTARVESVQADVKSAPERAQAVFGEYLATAVSAYGDLAGRGKSLVTRVRNQEATGELADQVKNTTSRAKATSTTAKRSAGATKSSAKATATTAKKSAARTRSSAKATGTSAKTTATAAKKATQAGADKVGE